MDQSHARCHINLKGCSDVQQDNASRLVTASARSTGDRCSWSTTRPNLAWETQWPSPGRNIKQVWYNLKYRRSTCINSTVVMWIALSSQHAASMQTVATHSAFYTTCQSWVDNTQFGLSMTDPHDTTISSWISWPSTPDEECQYNW